MVEQISVLLCASDGSLLINRTVRGRNQGHGGPGPGAYAQGSCDVAGNVDIHCMFEMASMLSLNVIIKPICTTSFMKIKMRLTVNISILREY